MAHRPVSNVSNAGRPFLLARAIAALLAAASLGAFADITPAPERAPSRAEAKAVAPEKNSTVELEKSFWFCDHAATKHGLHPSMAIACSMITDELKAAKFNGDFSAMLAWWRLNKTAQHQALDAAARLDATAGALSQR